MHVRSSSNYNVKVSRKNLRYSIKPILSFFFQEIKKQISQTEFLSIILTAPLGLRKKMLTFIFAQLFDAKKKRTLFFTVKENKCFNGCRAKKRKRKKHKGLRLYKT